MYAPAPAAATNLIAHAIICRSFGGDVQVLLSYKKNKKPGGGTAGGAKWAFPCGKLENTPKDAESQYLGGVQRILMGQCASGTPAGLPQLDPRPDLLHHSAANAQQYIYWVLLVRAGTGYDDWHPAPQSPAHGGPTHVVIAGHQFPVHAGFAWISLALLKHEVVTTQQSALHPGVIMWFRGDKADLTLSQLGVPTPPGSPLPLAAAPMPAAPPGQSVCKNAAAGQRCAHFERGNCKFYHPPAAGAAPAFPGFSAAAAAAAAPLAPEQQAAVGHHLVNTFCAHYSSGSAEVFSMYDPNAILSFDGEIHATVPMISAKIGQVKTLGLIAIQPASVHVQQIPGGGLLISSAINGHYEPAGVAAAAMPSHHSLHAIQSGATFVVTNHTWYH